ncbi:hypothetical protein POM88_005070 [Heracleum sosnowskyi]|uniref:Uncharacterized protein n=1 Tax=Heracleum sosnowskyi TaxID=360622 RepID=A0AAD8N8A4_9APIA|nr:hypothetical protein POM88_005070 [Heracleum sosnowskyi]
MESSDMSLRSCSTRKRILSEEEKVNKEKKKIKYMLMKDIISKKEDHMVDLLSSFKFKRFRKRGKSINSGNVRQPPFLGNWRCLKQKSKFKKGDMVDIKELLFSQDRDFLITYNDRKCPVQAKHLEDAEARKHPSITKLLASSERTHLINNNNQAVPLHNLEDKKSCIAK